LRKGVFILIFIAVCLCNSVFGINVINNQDNLDINSTSVNANNIKQINVENLNSYDGFIDDEQEKIKSDINMAIFYENALKIKKVENIVKIGIFVIFGIFILLTSNNILRKVIRKKRNLKQHTKQLEKLNNYSRERGVL